MTFTDLAHILATFSQDMIEKGNLDTESLECDAIAAIIGILEELEEDTYEYQHVNSDKVIDYQSYVLQNYM